MGDRKADYSLQGAWLLGILLAIQGAASYAAVKIVSAAHYPLYPDNLRVWYFIYQDLIQGFLAIFTCAVGMALGIVFWNKYRLSAWMTIVMALIWNWFNIWRMFVIGLKTGHPFDFVRRTAEWRDTQALFSDRWITLGELLSLALIAALILSTRKRFLPAPQAASQPRP